MFRRRLIRYGILLAIGIFFWIFLWQFDAYIAPVYDLLSRQSPITKKAELQKQFDRFERISWEEMLKTGYAQASGIASLDKNEKLYKQLEGKEFLIVKGFQRYRYVVGNWRIRDFLCKSRLVGRHVPIQHTAYTQYLLLDEELLLQALKLQQTCRDKGWNLSSLQPVSGYRNPKYNKMVGGKSLSRHQMGQAMDIWVADINGDGKSNEEDKNLIYNFLDKHVCQKGGLGKYKNSPRLVHFDSRGYRARW